MTGWKVGWVSGPAELVTAVTTVKQFLTFVGSGPFQPAVAAALGAPDEEFAARVDDLGRRRTLLADGLAEVGFGVHRPQAGYFVVADAAPLGCTDALEWCRELPHRAGVVGIPVQAFCADPAPVRTLVRFAFCKRPEVLQDAVERLRVLQA